MSNIDAQIAALQKKKLKIQYVDYILDLVKNDTKCIDFKDVQQDIVKDIEPFLVDLKKSVESDAQVPKAGLTPERVDALVILADKVIAAKNNPKTVTTPESTPVIPTPPPAPLGVRPAAELSPNEKMEFAMNNRALAGKNVKVLDDQNKVITSGEVVGLDAPFIVVKTPTGATIKVPLEKVSIT